MNINQWAYYTAQLKFNCRISKRLNGDNGKIVFSLSWMCFKKSVTRSTYAIRSMLSRFRFTNSYLSWAGNENVELLLQKRSRCESTQSSCAHGTRFILNLQPIPRRSYPWLCVRIHVERGLHVFVEQFVNNSLHNSRNFCSVCDKSIGLNRLAHLPRAILYRINDSPIRHAIFLCTTFSSVNDGRRNVNL